MATKPIVGLHHVTAIASDPQRNLDFYTQVLGLRFVKKTVNFDDPGTYHFYFGDDAGKPGTILTFFPWPNASRGTLGAGEVSHTAFSVPTSSIDYWETRLEAQGVRIEAKHQRFAATVLEFSDPDGMKIELVGNAEVPAVEAAFANPRFADVPSEHAVRGFYGVTLLQRNLAPTESALKLLGYTKAAEEGQRTRFEVVGDALAHRIDVVVDPSAPRGRMGAGTVHHIAFRSEDYADQKEWLKVISESLGVSPVMDRDYFRSIYFREPGGVLFELATDIPGFAIDEPLESLGEALRVPAWLQPHYEQIGKSLPPIVLHKAVKDAEKEEVQA
jgi:glyoxalase family protein